MRGLRPDAVSKLRVKGRVSVIAKKRRNWWLKRRSWAQIVYGQFVLSSLEECLLHKHRHQHEWCYRIDAPPASLLTQRQFTSVAFLHLQFEMFSLRWLVRQLSIQWLSDQTKVRCWSKNPESLIKAKVPINVKGMTITESEAWCASLARVTANYQDDHRAIDSNSVLIIPPATPSTNEASRWYFIPGGNFQRSCHFCCLGNICQHIATGNLEISWSPHLIAFKSQKTYYTFLLLPSPTHIFWAFLYERTISTTFWWRYP